MDYNSTIIYQLTKTEMEVYQLQTEIIWYYQANKIKHALYTSILCINEVCVFLTL